MTFGKSEWDRAERAFVNMMYLSGDQLLFRGVKLPSDMLTIVDVGAGPMPYGHALEEWALSVAKNVSIVALDPVYSFAGQRAAFYPTHIRSITKLALPIESAVPALQALGISTVNLLTLFNPAHGATPNMRSLGELCKGVPILGAVDGLLDANMIQELGKKQGYAVNILKNPFTSGMQLPWTRDYNPMFVAVPRSRA